MARPGFNSSGSSNGRSASAVLAPDESRRLQLHGPVRVSSIAWTEKDRPRWMKTMCARAESLLDDPAREMKRLQAIDESLSSLMRLIDTNDRWKVVGHQRPIQAESP